MLCWHHWERCDVCPVAPREEIDTCGRKKLSTMTPVGVPVCLVFVACGYIAHITAVDRVLADRYRPVQKCPSLQLIEKPMGAIQLLDQGPPFPSFTHVYCPGKQYHRLEREHRRFSSYRCNGQQGFSVRTAEINDYDASDRRHGPCMTQPLQVDQQDSRLGPL